MVGCLSLGLGIWTYGDTRELGVGNGLGTSVRGGGDGCGVLVRWTGLAPELRRQRRPWDERSDAAPPSAVGGERISFSPRWQEFEPL
jgi:hypothetical protein